VASKDASWVDLAITVGIVAAGVVLAALLVDWTIRKYVILAPPHVPDRMPPAAEDDDRRAA
jgi:hypothetical protein